MYIYTILFIHFVVVVDYICIVFLFCLPSSFNPLYCHSITLSEDFATHVCLCVIRCRHNTERMCHSLTIERESKEIDCNVYDTCSFEIGKNRVISYDSWIIRLLACSLTHSFSVHPHSLFHVNFNQCEHMWRMLILKRLWKRSPTIYIAAYFFFLFLSFAEAIVRLLICISLFTRSIRLLSSLHNLITWLVLEVISIMLPHVILWIFGFGKNGGDSNYYYIRKLYFDFFSL